jgi:hypothetical protein
MAQLKQRLELINAIKQRSKLELTIEEFLLRVSFDENLSHLADLHLVRDSLNEVGVLVEEVALVSNSPWMELPVSERDSKRYSDLLGAELWKFELVWGPAHHSVEVEHVSLRD